MSLGVGLALLIGGFGVGFIGLAWLVVFYMTQNSAPVAALGAGNIIIGLVLLFAGLPMWITGLVIMVASRRAAPAQQ